jgi:hypothetical protein
MRERRKPKRCKGCAFTPGTEAHGWPLIVLQAQACVEAAQPFLCHEVRAGARKPLCVGFVEAMDARHRKGLYDDLTDERREALAECIRWARIAEDEIGLDTSDPESIAAARRIAGHLRRTLRRTEDRVSRLIPPRAVGASADTGERA